MDRLVHDRRRLEMVPSVEGALEEEDVEEPAGRQADTDAEACDHARNHRLSARQDPSDCAVV